MYTTILCPAVDPAGTAAAHLGKMLWVKTFETGILKAFLCTEFLLFSYHRHSLPVHVVVHLSGFQFPCVCPSTVKRKETKQEHIVHVTAYANGAVSRSQLEIRLQGSES